MQAKDIRYSLAPLLEMVREPYCGPFERRPVSSRVNRVRNDDPDVLLPAPERKGLSKIAPASRATRLKARVPWSRVADPSLHFSPRAEAKCMRGPSGRGARRLARAGVLEQYVEHGKQAQRSHGGRIVCFDRRVVRNAG